MELLRLKTRRNELHGKMTATATDMYDTVTNPAKIIRKAVHDLAADQDFRIDLLKVATSAFSKWFTTNNDDGNTGGKTFNLINKILDFLSRRSDKH